VARDAPSIALPKTDHSVFYSYTITMGATEVGSFEKFSKRSTRTVERIRQVMYSKGAQVVDMAWGGTDISLELTHVELYKRSIIDELQGSDTGGMLDLEQCNIKFQIYEIMTMPTTTGTPKFRTIQYVDCVPSDIGKEIDIGTARVLETMTVQVRTVAGSDGWA